MASFRKTDPKGSKAPGRFTGGGPVAGSPFSQAQILHLMKTEFARARRYGFPVSCILVQVDRLDGLVDLYGGTLRDAVRQRVGTLVQEKTRGADHLGLASEDRYLIVLPHTGAADSLLVAERLRRSFNDLDIQVGGNELVLHLSIGVAGCEDQETLFFDTMLAQAEAALEHSVRSGGNRASLFHKDQITGVEDLDQAGGLEG
jgi:diguanylate cyclase (GGDEF)-like protein